MPDSTESGEDVLADLVEEELACTFSAVETAAHKIQMMLQKSREDDTGVKLEVNERLLDSCTGLMKAIKDLITKSKELQSEIVGEGMVSGHVEGVVEGVEERVCVYVEKAGFLKDAIFWVNGYLRRPGVMWGERGSNDKYVKWECFVCEKGRIG